jgi:PAS domain S-box-containing protein
MTDGKTKRSDSITDAEARQLAETRLEKSLQDNRCLMERILQLLQIQRKISSRQSLNDILDSIIYSIVDLLNVDAAEVLLLDPDGRHLTSRATALVEPNPMGTQLSITDRSIVERVIRDRKPVAIGDMENEPEHQVSILLGGQPVRALASTPMKIEEDVIGVVNVYSSKPMSLTDEDLQTLAMFSEGAAMAVSNAKIYMNIDRERKRLQTVLDTIPSGLIVVEGPDIRVAFMNRRSQEFFGTPPEIGKPLPTYLASSKLLHPDNTPFDINELPIYRSLRSGEVVRGEELVIEPQDGQRHYLLLGSAPLYDESGGIYGAVASTEDITPLREGEEALRQAYIRESRVSQTRIQSGSGRGSDRRRLLRCLQSCTRPCRNSRGRCRGQGC